MLTSLLLRGSRWSSKDFLIPEASVLAEDVRPVQTLMEGFFEGVPIQGLAKVWVPGGPVLLARLAGVESRAAKHLLPSCLGWGRVVSISQPQFPFPGSGDHYLPPAVVPGGLIEAVCRGRARGSKKAAVISSAVIGSADMQCGVEGGGWERDHPG